jgi:hypothetical protein
VLAQDARGTRGFVTAVADIRVPVPVDYETVAPTQMLAPG